MEEAILKNLGRAFYMHKSLKKIAENAKESVNYLNGLGMLKSAVDDNTERRGYLGLAGATAGGLAGYGLSKAIADRYVDQAKDDMLAKAKSLGPTRFTPQEGRKLLGDYLSKIKKSHVGVGAGTAGLALLGGYLGSRDW